MLVAGVQCLSQHIRALCFCQGILVDWRCTEVDISSDFPVANRELRERRQMVNLDC